jgi:hypothetical protein
MRWECSGRKCLSKISLSSIQASFLLRNSQLMCELSGLVLVTTRVEGKLRA